jgi:hypothetical protein
VIVACIRVMMRDAIPTLSHSWSPTLLPSPSLPPSPPVPTTANLCYFEVATVKLMQIPDALVNCRVPSEAQLAPASLTMDHPTLPKLLVASYPFRLSSDLSKSSSSPDLIYLCRGLRGQTHVFYNGKQALVNRRSTVSFHTPMKLGKHDGGLHRCNSAPRLLQVEPGVHGRFDEAGDGEKGVTRCEIL